MSNEAVRDEQLEELQKLYQQKREKRYFADKIGKFFPMILLAVFIGIVLIVLIIFYSPSQIQGLTISQFKGSYQKGEFLKVSQTLPQVINLQNLQPFYIWLGEMREKDIQMLNSLPYSFRLIRDCDKLLQKMQDEILQKFNREVYQRVNVKSDVCRMIVLYYYGGLYLDLDTIIDLSCLKKYLKDKRIFFEATPGGKVDIFAIYSSRPYDPEILKAIKSENTYSSQRKSNPAMTLKISNDAKTIDHSGCIKHEQERSWVSLALLDVAPPSK